MSIPAVLGTTLENLPAEVPYLSAPPDYLERWSRRIGSGSANLTVGLSWVGNPQHMRDRWRSIPFHELLPLLQLPGVEWFGLQKNAGTEPLRDLPADLPFVNLDSELHSFSDTAAAIAALDLVISVDTAVAHLAGALGKPVWTLLPFSPNYRWMLNRTDSPWYPTMRLWRQPAHHDWASVVKTVVEGLDELTRQSRSCRR